MARAALGSAGCCPGFGRPRVNKPRAFRVVFVAFAVVGVAALWKLRGVLLGTRVDAPLELLASGGSASPRAFNDVAAAMGITHVHHKPRLDAKLDPIRNWVASVGAAAAACDFDRDGHVDLYVTDSMQGEPNRLYHNRGDGTFEDVAARAGVAQVNGADGISTDCVFGDFDNDGWQDLYVAKWGHNQLFRNRGDGSFEDVTRRAFRDERGEPGAPWANACAALWFDYDGDGWLDLYVGNYFAPFDLFHLDTTRIMHDSFENSRNAGRNALWRNRGDGTFQDVAAELGLDDPGWTLAVGHGDLNNDGWPDLYVANDFGPDHLFVNRGDGRFSDVTTLAIGPDTKKGMNAEFGDFDGDGWLDVQVSNITTAEYLREGNMLWRNAGLSIDGIPLLDDVAQSSRAADGGWGWGAKFLDYDHDGDLDLFGANGFVTAGAGEYWFDLASWTVLGDDVADALAWPPMGERSFSGREPDRLWRNDGHGRFEEIAASAGIDDRRDGRGVVAWDPDGDGDLDLYVANQGAAPGAWRNDAGSRGHWLQILLHGLPARGSNRDAIGARVTLVTARGMQVREKDGGNGYCGQSDPRLHFGLGDETRIETLEIRWPSRRVQVLHGVAADRVLEITEPAELPTVASLVPTRHEKRRARTVEAARVPARPAPTAAEATEELASLEREIERRTDDIALASRYRARCTLLQQRARSIEFLEDLTGRQPGTRNLHFQLALAYIDAIPTCGGVAAVVSKGTLARKSLDQLDLLVSADARWWPALYARGMNHLHWPRALRHSQSAAEDFKRCIELCSGPEAQPRRNYHVRAYVGQGDALAKDGDVAAARAAWRRGLELFPGTRELSERLELSDESTLRDFIERERNLEQAVDTDFSFLLDG